MSPTSPSQQQFILHWGEMSSRWGINRSMAQIHALLYLSEEPLNAEQISQELSIARSNVSNSLRELRAWGIVRAVHHLGDRRECYEAVSDVWDMFLTILEQRKRREMDPTLETLRGCIAEEAKSQGEETLPLQRMRSMLDLLELLNRWYEQMRSLSPAAQRRILKMGGRLTRMVAEIRPKELKS